MEAAKKVFKLAKTELESIQNIQQKYQNITFSYGQNLLEKRRLDDALKDNDINKQELDTQFETIKTEEKKIMNDLTNKYGVGNIDLQSGEITVVQQNSNLTDEQDAPTEEVTQVENK